MFFSFELNTYSVRSPNKIWDFKDKRLWNSSERVREEKHIIQDEMGNVCCTDSACLYVSHDFYMPFDD